MNIISNPEEKKVIKGALQEMSESMTRISAERDLIKTIREDLLEAFKDKLTPKQINKMARVYHNQSFKKEVAQHEEFEILYETITGEKLEE